MQDRFIFRDGQCGRGPLAEILLAIVLFLSALFPVSAQTMPGILAQQPETGGQASKPQTQDDHTGLQTPIKGAGPIVGERDYRAAERELQAARQELERIRDAVEDGEPNDTTLTEMQGELERLASRMIDLGLSISPRLEEIRARLEQIGPPPENENVEEPQIVVEERNRLTEERARINALIGSAEEISLGANQGIERVSERRRQIFAEALVARTPITQSLLNEAGVVLMEEASRLKRTLSNWAQDVWSDQRNALIQAIGLSLVSALILLFGSYRVFGGLVTRDPLIEEPSYVSRLSVAFWSTVIPTAAASAFAVSIYGLMEAMGLLRETVGDLFALGLAVVVATYFVGQLTFAVLTPASPRWRLIEVSDRGARTLCLYVVAIAVVSSLDYFASGVSAVLGSDVAVTVAKTFLAVVVIGLLLTALSFVRPMQVNEERYGKAATRAEYERRRAWTPPMRIALRVAGIGLILLALAGYIGLARFIASQIIITGAILTTMYIGFLCGRAVASVEDFGQTYVGRILERRLKLGSVALDQAGLVSSLAIYLLVLILGIPLILLQWGFRPQDISGWFVRIFTEIRFGNVSISLVGIGVGILVFIIGYFITRWFQRWMDGNVLARGRVDAGVRNSISTAVGYAGVAIAGLIGVSAAGLDLSNLALVAGALSLGIGFGLQTIVSNFVSGLILLAERPFKVGDWVVSGTTEGFVKRISVRATEIETFQRQSIMVPNSELINASVGNWTHRNQLGRLEIPVRVAYGTDPRRVIAILNELALAHELVMRNPEPYVMFKHFGDFAMEFELRAFLGDILLILDVGTDLRVAIYERFREEGIHIPFPRQEVMLRAYEAPPHGGDRPADAPLRQATQRRPENVEDTLVAGDEAGGDSGGDGR